MIGWLILFLVALAALLLLWRTGFPRTLWSFAGAALMLGAAGYALQGSPGLSGSPVLTERKTAEVDPDVVELRHALFGKFTSADMYFVAADGMARAGNTGAAVNVLLSGVGSSPKSLPLWTGVGLAYAAHDGNQISPAAKFAFDQAIKLNPQHPGPYFFLGLAHVRANDFAGARPYWARAVALSPEGAPYRPALLVRLMLLDRFLQMQQAARAVGQGS